jgi:hypothetical protein
MKKVFFTIGLGLSTIANAQNYLHQAIILNEGKFDYSTSTIVEPVTIGSYNPVTKAYEVVDTLEGMRFASDLIIDGDFYYVAADTKIFKMDLNTHRKVDWVSCPGVRNLVVYQNKLIATRGEYLTKYDSYLHVFDASNMSLIQKIDTSAGPKWASQNIVIDGSNAYIAVNNGYEWGNEKGIIGRLDLTNLTYGNEIDLGADGKNPDNLVKHGNTLISVNNKDWSGSSISKIDLTNASASTVNLSLASTGCGTSALRGDKIVYQISNETALNEFDPILMNNVGPISGLSINFYELAEEPVSGNFYASATDYTTYGKVYIYDNSNTELKNFNVGIAPGTIAFDVRPMSAGIVELANEISVSPNPANESIQINNFQNGVITVSDLSGKVILTSNESQINVNNLTSGTYFVSANGASAKFIKL